MARSDRLFEIIQILRAARQPVTACRLAERLEVSERTIYRDMATLMGRGVPVFGEAGLGYVMRSGYDLPPLMFTAEEVEAIVLGARMVMRAGDRTLAAAADSAVAKIETVLTDTLRQRCGRTALFVPGDASPPVSAVDIGRVRAAVREERKLRIRYADATGAMTERMIWPLAIGYFHDVAVIAAWCELRRDFRHFRGDRLHGLETLAERFDGRHGGLLRDWLAREIEPERRSAFATAFTGA